jgi:hypothetical protein
LAPAWAGKSIMGEEPELEDGGGGWFSLPPNSPLSRLRIYSYMVGVISGIITVFTVERPPKDAALSEVAVFLIFALGNALLIGMLALILREILKLLVRLIRSARRAHAAVREARTARAQEAVVVGGRRRRTVAPSISRGHLYGFMWGIMGAVLLTYNVAPPTGTIMSSFADFLVRVISNLILLSLFIGGLGYLLGVFARRPWITLGNHFTGYMFGTTITAVFTYSLGLRPLTPHTPFFGGLTGLCFILVPMAEGYLLLRLLSQRNEGQDTDEGET